MKVSSLESQVKIAVTKVVAPTGANCPRVFSVRGNSGFAPAHACTEEIAMQPIKNFVLKVSRVAVLIRHLVRIVGFADKSILSLGLDSETSFLKIKPNAIYEASPVSKTGELELRIKKGVYPLGKFESIGF